MKLKDCRSIKEVLKWMQKKGFTPGENALVGTVHDVHTDTSLHYRMIKDGQVVLAPSKQGRLAADVNDNDLDDDKLPFDSEHEALAWMYERLLEIFGPRGFNVLDELFFNGLGFIKENPTSNHPISGHDHHLHVAFREEDW